MVPSAEILKACEDTQYDAIFVLETRKDFKDRSGTGRTTTERAESVKMGQIHKGIYSEYFPDLVFDLPESDDQESELFEILSRLPVSL